VIAFATAKTFLVPGDFFGAPGLPYDNVKVAQIANTMAARNLGYFPRNATQNANVTAGGLVDWARVAGYASKGISSGTAFDWVFHQDGCNTWCDFLKVWTNDVTTMRLHTRVSKLMDPATQPDPWDITTNTHPNSPDKRLGDGTFRGSPAYAASVLDAYPDTNCAKPVGCTGGLDYVWIKGQEFGNKTRGSWHQSAIGQVRYDSFPGCGDNPLFTNSPGALDGPLVLAAENDLIWAEALIRGPTPDLATAASLINRTRVGPDRMGRRRGGLPPPTAGVGKFLAQLQYEQDVELPGSNNAPFYNMRRINKLEPNTPHEMPVPAKELGVDRQPLYTCGGAAHPDGSCGSHTGSGAPPVGSAAVLMQRAPQLWARLQQEAYDQLRSHVLRSRNHK
jgi:hypothetical protein